MNLIYCCIFLSIILSFIFNVFCYLETEKIKKKQEKDTQHLLNNIKQIANLIENNEK